MKFVKNKWMSHSMSVISHIDYQMQINVHGSQ